MAKDPRIMADRLAQELEAKGFREAVDIIFRGLGKHLATLRKEVLRGHDKPGRRPNAKPLALRANSDQARVLHFIKKSPGLRGVEIVRAMETGGDHAIKERTLRTALRRLRQAGYIKQDQGGGWVPSKGAPKE
jgi:hypothetical protein